jgi:two-component system cell cycle response regulator DivK
MSKRILVIEDHEDNRRILRDLLTSAGYEPIEGVTGEEGVALAETHRPDLILMDIQLPEVSGLEVTRWIKEDESLKDIPVVAVTAFAMKGDEEKMREGGCEAYIAKPISVGKFIETVRRFLS